MLLFLSICCFFITAILGGFLLSYILMNKETPKAIALIHGPFAALGIIFLLIYTLMHTNAPWVSLLLFILAALGGFYIFFRDITNQFLPKWLPLGHGLIAVFSFILLILFAMH